MRGKRRLTTQRWLLIGAAAVAVVAAGGTMAVWGNSDTDQNGPGLGGQPPATATPVQMWRVETGADLTGPPAASANLVHVGGADGVIRALRRTDGKTEWSYRTEASVAVAPRVVDGVVYAASANGAVHAIDADDGTIRWTRHTGIRVGAPPAVDDERVYVGGNDSVLYTFRLVDRWRQRYWVDGEIRTTPAVADGRAYVAGRDRDLYGITLSTGQSWHRSIGSVVAGPAVDGNTVCVGTDAGTVRCADADTGRLTGHVDGVGRLTSTPVVHRGLVIGARTDGTVTAWATDTGTQRWRFPPAAAAPGACFPTLDGDVVYVAGPAGRLAAVDAGTGIARWEFAVDDQLSGAPLVADGMLYVGGKGGAVYAFRLPGSLSAPPSATPATSPSARTRAATRAPTVYRTPPRRATSPIRTSKATTSPTSAKKKAPPTPETTRTPDGGRIGVGPTGLGGPISGSTELPH